MGDSLYDKIISGLAGELDPRVFEDCVCDLLRDAFPTLVPIRGGQDAGMDGAIADGEGEAYPLVCTTGRDVIGNLKRSLESYTRQGGRRRKAVLATSQELTQRRRRNLQERARELGFTLIQIFERSGIADRIYRDPRWLRDLLGLCGRPSALSAVPPSRRLLVEVPLIGRDEELSWLRSSAGDRVLVGEPGSGKTYLLLELVREGRALFLVDDDAAAIANAIREQQPEIVVVDDAHCAPEQLMRLRQMREEIVATFDILAATWLGDRDRVVEALGSPPDANVRRLELLTREEILQVIRAVGVEATDEELRMLVDEAANKPGLAVFLGSLWKQGAWQEVLDGSAVQRLLLPALVDLVGRRASGVLARFAIGGDRGMTMKAVASSLERLDLDTVRDVTIGLAVGGVLSEVGGRSLAVWPRTLRWALVRDTFFRGDGTDLPYERLLDVADSRDSAIETIVMAVARGAVLPRHELQALLTSTASKRAWQAFAVLDSQAARWTIENHPGGVIGIARETLRYAPRETLEHLLRPGIEDETSRRSIVNVIGSWVRDFPESGFDLGDALRRRRLVVEGAVGYLAREGDRALGFEVLCLAFSPKLEGTSVGPGLGRLIFRWGLLPIAALPDLERLWDEASSRFDALDETTWPPLSGLIREWTYPRVPNERGTAEDRTAAGTVRARMNEFAGRLIHSLLPLAAGRPGAAVALERLAIQLKLELAVDRVRDEVFDLLYVEEEDPELRKAKACEIDAAVDALAEAWAARPPSEVAEILGGFEKEAEVFGMKLPRRSRELCRRLAARVEEPDRWLWAFETASLPQGLVGPFLRALAESEHEGWQDELEARLGQDTTAWVAMQEVLRLDEPPGTLLARALERAPAYVRMIRDMALRGELSRTMLEAMLAHSDLRPALAAAAGLWVAHQGAIPADLREVWRDAILRAPADAEREPDLRSLAFRLVEIFRNEPALAFDWVGMQLDEGLERSRALCRQTLLDVIESLSKSQRLAVIGELRDHNAIWEVVRPLVGDDVGLYRALLGRQDLSRFHLLPLERAPDNTQWLALAEAALEAGELPRGIARVALSTFNCAGSGVQYWRRHYDTFAALLQHSHPGIREVGRFGQGIAKEREEEARAEEKQVAIRGIS